MGIGNKDTSCIYIFKLINLTILGFKIENDVNLQSKEEVASKIFNTDFTDSLMETSTILTEGTTKKTINIIPKSSYKKSIRNAGRNRHFQNTPSLVKNYLYDNFLASAKKGDKEKFIDSLTM